MSEQPRRPGPGFEDDGADLFPLLFEQFPELGEHRCCPIEAALPRLRIPGDDTILVCNKIGRYVSWNRSIPPTLTAPRVSPW